MQIVKAFSLSLPPGSPCHALGGEGVDSCHRPSSRQGYGTVPQAHVSHSSHRYCLQFPWLCCKVLPLRGCLLCLECLYLPPFLRTCQTPPTTFMGVLGEMLKSQACPAISHLTAPTVHPSFPVGSGFASMTAIGGSWFSAKSSPF